MPSISSRRRRSGVFLQSFYQYALEHLNFFRIHLLYFTFTPLIISGIFQASNGNFKVSYIDSLFNCVSAMTVCGLATVDLSGLTNFQQFLLFLQMCLGNPVVISWVMVYTRRSFFARKFRRIMETRMARRLASKTDRPVQVKLIPWWRRALERLSCRVSPHNADEGSISDTSTTQSHSRNAPPRVRPDMIRRMDDAPKLINPSGWISEGRPDPTPAPVIGSSVGQQLAQLHWTTSLKDFHSRSESQQSESPSASSEDTVKRRVRAIRERRVSDPGVSQLSIASKPPPVSRFETINVTPRVSQDVQNNKRTQISRPIPRTQTVEFADPPRPNRYNHSPRQHPSELPSFPTVGEEPSSSPPQDTRFSRAPTMSLPRTATQQTHQSQRSQHTHHTHRTLHRGFGGFPMPHEIAGALMRKFFPDFQRRLHRTMTMPRTRTIVSQNGTFMSQGRPVPYLSFEAVVGRNSTFKSLTREQLEELGGVEYRALSALLWIVGGYHILSQLIAFTVIAPYMSIPRWRADFRPPVLHRDLSPVWFSGFQVVSAYTNTGMSLEDTSLIPFQTAYPMIFFVVFLILAGNTAFPIFLRLTIWVVSKLVPTRARIHETLHFLLDHPRRCFVYLFPSHQTWFLLAVLVVLNGTDWFFFLVLDIGNPALDIIPLGVRFAIGLLQATAVRAAGFATVSLESLAPAVKVLYVLMMYISVYPVAMTVRSTNVYEEKSLGVFEDEDESVEVDQVVHPEGNRVRVWGRYVAMHMRKQLSFDMWWLGLALFLVCIIEKGGLDNSANATWFNIFTILFELVSAYGTVGLSLGLPYANYSFSGALQPLSKLIICAVMIRGRHRGLPVAIDRAVMLPFEFQPHLSEDETRTPSWEDGHNEDANGEADADADAEEGRRNANTDHRDGDARINEKSERLEVPRRSSWMPGTNAGRATGEAEMQKRAAKMVDEELQEVQRVDS